jgi:hypothetical protein
MAPAPKAAGAEEDLSTIMYSNPARYAQIIEERAEQRILSKLNTQNQVQHRTNTVMQELGAEYPELSDINSELTQKALSALKTLPENEQATTAGYRYAVKQAAEELNVKPKSKRPQVDEDFSGGYGSGALRRRAPGNKLAPDTEAFAQALGMDLEDPALKDRLIKRQQRDWNRPEHPLSSKTKKGSK